MRRVVLALLTTLLLARPAFAEPTRAPEGASMKAQASLDFRIVIPETLHMHSRDERAGHPYTFVSQSTQVRADRIVVTVAKT